MIQSEADLSLSKSKGRIIFQYFLLAFSLCAIALRATYSAGPDANIAGQPLNLADNLFDAAVSSLLIISFCLWLLWFFYAAKTSYRMTGIEAGLFLFIIASVLATFAASDKRAAINECVLLLTPVLMTVVLVQILDSKAKIILTLTVIAALGAVCAYQCAEQFFVSNRIMLEQYKAAPETILEPLGIQPDSFEQMLLEHRLLSNDVRGFFTTGNSAGSFLLLCGFAALVIVLHNLKHRKHLTAASLVLAAIVFGFILTHSKGAIAASILAATMLAVYLLAGQWLKARRKTVLILCLLSVLAAGGLIVLYGLKYGRLPGGNSMFVRWQYWLASFKMYTAHALTGVGPGNFAYFYPRYKLPAALETVTDPHNFLLTILTQFGPLGLAGFLAFIFVPLWKIIFPRLSQNPNQNLQDSNLSKKLVIVFAVIIGVALLAVRPAFVKIPIVTATFDVLCYASFVLYIIPLLIFLAAVCFLNFNNGESSLPERSFIAAVLFCAIAGCLVHNLIDFALFEPGIYITIFALLACLIAAGLKANCRTVSVKSSVPKKLFVTIIVLAITSGYFSFYLLPVVKSTVNIRKSVAPAASSQFKEAHVFLTLAAKEDCLNPLPLSLKGRLYLNQFFTGGANSIELLLQARKSLLAALERNNADFKNHARLAEVYILLAQISQNQAEADYLQNAFDSASVAVKCYPGSSHLRITIAETAEQLGKNNIALEQYRKAIEIEDAYREQFRAMYPDRKVFSRLGEEKYNLAKQRIEYLSNQMNR